MFVLWILRHRRALNLLFWPYFRKNFKPSAGQNTDARTNISLQLLLVLSASITHTEGWLKPSISGLISPKNHRSWTANIQFTEQTSPWCCSPPSPTESSAWRCWEIFCWKHAIIFPQKTNRKHYKACFKFCMRLYWLGGSSADSLYIATSFQQLPGSLQTSLQNAEGNQCVYQAPGACEQTTHNSTNDRTMETSGTCGQWI